MSRQGLIPNAVSQNFSVWGLDKFGAAAESFAQKHRDYKQGTSKTFSETFANVCVDDLDGFRVSITRESKGPTLFLAGS